MVSFSVLFYMFVIMFGIIGAVRGWAKEILVVSSIILALFIIIVLESYAPFIKDMFAGTAGVDATILIPKPQFWMRIVILGLLSFFGYQTPSLSKIAGARFAREKLQDTLLGLFLGTLNGYLLIGTLWFFIHQIGYDLSWISQAPPEESLQMVEILPPNFLMKAPNIFFAAGLVFIFILVVFI